MMMSKPEKDFRCGAVSASIWPVTRTVKDNPVTFYSVKIEKAFKDGDSWKHSNTFSVDDLPGVTVVSQEAFKYLRLKTRTPD